MEACPRLCRPSCPTTWAHRTEQGSSWPPPGPHALTLAQPTGRAGSAGLPLGSEQLGPAGPAGDGSFQAGGVLVPPVSMSSSPLPWCPARRSLVYLLIAPLPCARLCLSPSSCGQSGDPALYSPPGPCLLHPHPLCALPVLAGGWDKFQELHSGSAHACSPGPALPRVRPHQAARPASPST